MQLGVCSESLSYHVKNAVDIELIEAIHKRHVQRLQNVVYQS